MMGSMMIMRAIIMIAKTICFMKYVSIVVYITIHSPPVKAVDSILTGKPAIQKLYTEKGLGYSAPGGPYCTQKCP